MSTPPLAPRSSLWSIIAVWVVSAVAGIVIGFVVPPGHRAEWLTIALGGAIIVSFAVQLAPGRPEGFIRRVALSVVGALFVLGIIGIVFGLATVATV